MATSTFINSASGYTSSTVTSLDCSSTLTLQTGDLLVAMGTWQSGTSVTGSIADNAGGNSFIMKGQTNDAVDLSECDGYLIYTGGGGTFTFRLTITGGGGGYVSIVVLQFRPASGATIAFDSGPSLANNTSSSAIASGTINTDGGTSDEIIVGIIAKDNNRTYSGEKIAGVAITGFASTTYGRLLYLLDTGGARTGINAVSTANSNCEWIADILAFKATGASGMWLALNRP